MITVITNENHSEDTNLYEGMSLAEACGEMSLNVANIMNEMEMSILLSEHAYLYENGYEIEYVTEGEDNANGKSVKEKIINAIKSAAKWVAGLWDKLVKWIQERLDDVANFFRAKGLTKKVLSKAVNAFDFYYPNGLTLKNEEWKKDFDFSQADAWFNKDSFFVYAKDAAANRDALSDSGERKSLGLASVQDFYDSFVSENKSKKIVTKAEFKEAADSIYDNTFVKNVRTEQKACVDGFNKLIRDVRSNNGDKIEIENYKASITLINNFSKAAVKAWRDYVSQNVSIVKSAVSDKNFRKLMEGNAKADKAAEEFKKNSVKESAEDSIFDGKYFCV